MEMARCLLFKKSLPKTLWAEDVNITKYLLNLAPTKALIKQNAGYILMHQKKYGSELLKNFKMENYKSVATPLVTENRFGLNDGNVEANETYYKNLIGSLLYLSTSRPDIMHATSLLSRFMQKPSEVHLMATKRILRYAK
ncbi:PREDICTED: uncharacterized mitochondrial protein AtMg00810-like [Theobroma cacao]|uniref:Uncharacterized mitochondrial protein AtMg00810-like n=1 Tax=Theobroma cacao TaxID=3641 RepID=A0AB32WSN0_THECC|nr:PREDICTED: uncharacterized mitochondrial protein AtMg00810-like [Theobroma cacao]